MMCGIDVDDFATCFGILKFNQLNIKYQMINPQERKEGTVIIVVLTLAYPGKYIRKICWSLWLKII